MTARCRQDCRAEFLTVFAKILIVLSSSAYFQNEPRASHRIYEEATRITPRRTICFRCGKLLISATPGGVNTFTDGISSASSTLAVSYCLLSDSYAASCMLISR